MSDTRLLVTWKDGTTDEYGCPEDLVLPEQNYGTFNYYGGDEGFGAAIALSEVRSLRVYKLVP